MIQTQLLPLLGKAGVAISGLTLRRWLQAACQRLAPKAAQVAAGTLAAMAAPLALAHEGHGALSDLHAHGDSLWTLALLAAVVLIGLLLKARK